MDSMKTYDSSDVQPRKYLGDSYNRYRMPDCRSGCKLIQVSSSFNPISYPSTFSDTYFRYLVAQNSQFNFRKKWLK